MRQIAKYLLPKICVSNAKTVVVIGMLRHSLRREVIFSKQHFIAPALDLMACLPSRQMREAIKALNPRREQESDAKT